MTESVRQQNPKRVAFPLSYLQQHNNPHNTNEALNESFLAISDFIHADEHVVQG